MLRRLLALGLLLSHVCSAMGVDPQVEHVVLVSVDGLSASYLDDPRADLPNLRSIAAEGVRARGMLTSFPSVTWPSHTSLVTGSHPAKHGVIGNSVWDRSTHKPVTYIGDPVLTKSAAIRAPTLYDLAHRSGLSTASVIWPCSNGASTLDFVIPDSNKPSIHAQYTTPGLADELLQAGIDISPLGDWGWGKEYSVQRDILYTRVTGHLLEEHRINLMLVHLITPDGVQHAYGPNTPPAYEAVAETDRRLGEIWTSLQKEPFVNKSAMFVVSDHGFAAYDKLIHPNVLLRELGLIETDQDGQVIDRRVWCVAQGGSAFVYVLDEERRDNLLETLPDRLAGVEGVLSVIRTNQFASRGLADPNQNPQAPDLVLTTGPGYSFSNGVIGELVASVGGSKGSHGHDPQPPYMHATFVAAGKGIRPGTRLDIIRNVDVAPTIAHLLGLEMDCDGQVLREALTRP